MSILHKMKFYIKLPLKAKKELINDLLLGLPKQDPGILLSIDSAISWICRAQDCSKSNDGGVARHYSLIDGWSDSYPETTGYIIPTMIEYGKLKKNDRILERAKRMLDWLVRIQFENGAFPGGTIGQEPVKPVTFNTGQILLGLAAGEKEFGIYRKAMLRAADWLVETQNDDGCWRDYPSPFALASEKVYDTHVSWGLYEIARLESNSRYSDAALINIRWALRLQKNNGWFSNCCLVDPAKPLTHTIGYTLRGLIEAYRYEQDPQLLEASIKTANGILAAINKSGFIPGRLNDDWQGSVSWSCLTGSVQIAICWLLLYKYTGDSRYQKAAYAANKYVRRTVKIDGDTDTRGALKGSFPISGDYGMYEYLNWAAKFFIDSNMLEHYARIEADHAIP